MHTRTELVLVPIVIITLIQSPGARAERQPTTQTSIGLFYQPGAPETADLWREGDEGERLKLSGRVLNPEGQPVADALVELWHADTSGSVDETRYRSAQRTTADGRFGIRTVLPGHIEMARYNATFAPRHIHIRVTHPDHPSLVSLILFQGDERLVGSPYPELAIPLEKVRVGSGEVFVAGVEIVLGAAPLPPGYWQDRVVSDGPLRMETGIIFLAMFWGGGGPYTIPDIIAVYDWTNRAIPGRLEMQTALNTVLAMGLIEQQKNEYSIPKAQFRAFDAFKMKKRKDKFDPVSLI